jgi:2-dehydropantoate 2-reductase
MGSLLACKLQRCGLPVRLLVRDSATPLEDVEIQLREGLNKQCFSIPARHASRSGPIHRLLITTKANQALEAFRSIRQNLQPGAPVVLLHNGMGVLEQLQATAPDQDLYCGTTTEGAYWHQPGILEYAGQGATLIGQPSGGVTPPWFKPLFDSGEHFDWTGDIDQVLWRKLLINCAINPLTAIHQCRNGELLEQAEWQAELRSLCVELENVSHACGYHQLAAQTWDSTCQVLRATAHNKSSMLRDIQARRETEINYITGYLLRRAQQAGVNCPHNQRMQQAVRRLSAAAE